jgi:geranylgeranyl pyrophosphate synthase
MNRQEFEAHYEALRAEAEHALTRHLARLDGRHGPVPGVLQEAMEYAVLGGGKRVRPVLAMAACEAAGGRREEALPLACALEFIHAYSLVHDDLPCMDDDDERRGRPTLHRRYNEPTALLVGDGLQAEAFRALTGRDWGASPQAKLEIIGLVAEAAGVAGMVGGQQFDMDAEGRRPSDAEVFTLHAMKTGALFLAAVLGGGLAGGADVQTQRHLDRYGRALGLAFQITDDLLDVDPQLLQTGDPHEDAVNLAVRMGPVKAREEAAHQVARAREAAHALGERGAFLVALADFIERRRA